MQLKTDSHQWAEYGERAETRREHLLEIQAKLGFQSFTTRQYQASIEHLVSLAEQTDKGIVLANALIDALRRQSVLLPSSGVIERACAEAITRANRRIYATLTEPLSVTHRQTPRSSAHAQGGQLDHLVGLAAAVASSAQFTLDAGAYRAAESLGGG